MNTNGFIYKTDMSLLQAFRENLGLKRKRTRLKSKGVGVHIPATTFLCTQLGHKGHKRTQSHFFLPGIVCIAIPLLAIHTTGQSLTKKYPGPREESHHYYSRTK